MNRSLLAFLALPALLCLPLACKSAEGHDRAASTASQVVSLGSIAGQTQLQLDRTLNALGQVVAKAQQDPKPAFDEFVSELGAFDKSFAELSRARESLKTQAETWFTDFDKQNNSIQDAELRQAGVKRLGEFRTQVASISSEVDGLMVSTRALQTQLTDLRTFLGNDLTAPGIASVSNRVTNVTKDGREVAAGLGKLSKTSETLASKLRAAQMPEPK